MEIVPYDLTLDPPLRTADGTINARSGYLVYLDGGVGDAAPLPGWTESDRACRRALETTANRLAADGPAAALDELDSQATPAARHGLALAIADRRAQVAVKPLYRALGGSHRETVPVNATIGICDTDTTIKRARSAVAAGVQTVKLKLNGEAIDDEIDRIRAVRTALDPPVRLRGDANGAWSFTQAERVYAALEPATLEYIEQPLPAADLSGHARLRGPDRVGVALDESCRDHALSTILAADTADVVILKPMAVGGPMRARALATRAHAAGCTPVITTTIDGVVARTGAVHVAASLPESTAHGLATADRLVTDQGPDPAPVTDGAIAVPQQPGHGVTQIDDRYTPP
ncbi:MAG: mandelate racemase/muconate lactonizing enzyme family protein [Salinarchaeum sp.]